MSEEKKLLKPEELEDVTGGNQNLRMSGNDIFHDEELTGDEWTCPVCGQVLSGVFLKIQVMAHKREHSITDPTIKG